MVKVAVYPPNSLVLADLIERKGHKVLALQKEMRKKIKDPEIDSPPMNITEEDPIAGLKYAAIEVPSGVRGRMAIIGPIIDEAEAAIIVDGAPYGFGCVGCQRTNEISTFLLRQRDIPQLELDYPTNRDEAMEMVNDVFEFLDNIENPNKKTKKNKEEIVSKEDEIEIVEEEIKQENINEDNSNKSSVEHMKTSDERKLSEDDLIASLKSKRSY